jgi:peptidoglycan/LPS O-acetylase OafA/YrhL
MSVPQPKLTSSTVADAAGGHIQGFDTLRAAAVLSVVVIHASDAALRDHNYFPTPSFLGSVYLLVNSLLHFCVPVFLMMSAFLVERKVVDTGRPAAPRAARLVRPILAVTAVYVPLTLLQRLAVHKPLFSWDYAAAVLLGHCYYHTWYLPVALIYSYAHNALRKLVEGWRIWVWAAAGFMVYALRDLRYSIDTTPAYVSLVFNAALSLPYYAFGIWAAQNRGRLSRVSVRMFLGMAGAGLVLGGWFALRMSDRGMYTPGILLLSCGLFLAAVFSQRPALEAARRTASVSLGIYLWHMLFLVPLQPLGHLLYRRTHSELLCVLMLVVSVVISVGCSAAVSQRLRQTSWGRGLAQ